MADDKDAIDKTKKEDKKAEENDQNNSGSKSGLILAAILAIVVIFLLGALVDHTVNYNRNHRAAVITAGFVGGGGMGFRQREFIGQAVTTNQIEVGGVVTAVNGQSFTLAGNGTTNTVQTNSSTQFVGASKVSVNDSVVAVGTTNNDTFMATQVVVGNSQ